MKKWQAVMVMTLAWVMGLPTSQAEPQPAPPFASSDKPKENFSDDQLKRFAQAHEQVEQVRERYQAQLKQAVTPALAQQVTQQGNLAMAQAIQAQGLDVATYNRIAQATREDEALRKRIVGFVHHVPAPAQTPASPP
jgi:hypothetical protein